MEEADLVIIGAGIYGLTAASTYHRLHPSGRIIILDFAPSIGGPWAPQRIFPGLKTNNLWGMYEHPDFPMDEEKFDVKKGEHVPAEKILDYLTAFVEWGDIKQFLRLRTAVEVIEKDENRGWILHCSPSPLTDPKGSSIRAKQLIIAVGNTNTPLLPNYPTSSTFTPAVLHSAAFPTHFSEVVRPNTHTVVIGSGKSAWDVAYACATQPNSTATMLIRPDGNGPMWMTPAHVTPLGLWLEKLVFTRFFGFMSPCPWASTNGIEGWFRSFFHSTWLGRKIVGAFWGILGEDAIALNKLDDHADTRKLRPWRGAFEVGNGLSIHNYPTSFFGMVREGRIKVVIDEVTSLGGTHNVHLKSGGTLQADAVVCATGWQKGYTFRFKPEGLEKELGMPSSQYSADEQALVKKTEAELYEQYPYLKDRDTSRTHHPDPSLRYAQKDKEEGQPYRLHRFIVPPFTLQDRSIAFAGSLLCLGSFPLAYIQSLWITSYFDGTLPLPSSTPNQILEETYRDTQYCVLRGAMGYGGTLPDLVFDSLPYFDTLLKDLGLEGRRKGGLLGVRECVKSYGPGDYRGLIEEVERREQGEGKKDI
ncbi:FAD/NAD(P)-binding domain-containing protein [Clathrospora elynae]|uniref:FAD/NAD(P)-binding domain-containing protein n=1 Tax=Clathrospora elynae TaxID=706981 RepID=A0A6A5T210_9PLEO|nr:FAD/NAD(P)-binding domain-containing protein [Clathrospora elynae]